MKLSQSDQILSAKISSASRQHRQDCRSCFGRSARRRRDNVCFDFFAFPVQFKCPVTYTRLLLKSCAAQIQRAGTELTGYLRLVKTSAKNSQRLNRPGLQQLATSSTRRSPAGCAGL